MTTRDLLEKDKEALLARLTRADSPQTAVAALDDELGRILLKYNESASSERLSAQAGYAVSTTRAALSFIDSVGEIKTWEERPPKKPSPAHLAPLSGGGAALVGAGLLFVLAPTVLAPMAWLLLAAGALGLFYGGLTMGRAKSPAAPKVRLETKMDGEKLYHALHGALTVVDANLEEARLEEEAEEAGPLPGEAVSDALPSDELSLLSGLLMNAYAARGEDGPEEIISDIRFYLHKKGIQVVDYSPETSRYFSRMPSKKEGTLSPALLKDGLVLIKGLAAARL